MRFVPPGRPGSIAAVTSRYENFIGGNWVAPAQGRYRVNLSPATGAPICEVPDSTTQDVELALDAAHGASRAWATTSHSGRARVLTAIADAIEAETERLAVTESWDNGKPVREALFADIPLVADRFRSFAAAIRAEEGAITEVGRDLVAYHIREPLGVVGQLVPSDLPLVTAAWTLAPVLAAGNCSVLKPASPTPWSLLVLAEVVADVVPPGVINIVNGPGSEVGAALTTNPRIAKVAFTGRTRTRRLIMAHATRDLVPVTLELGGTSPDIFFSDVMAADDEFLDTAVTGLLLCALNGGQVCTCPSRALVQHDIYDEFLTRCLDRAARIVQGDPLDEATMLGAQVSAAQLDRIESAVQLGRSEGAEVLIGGARARMHGEFAGGHYFRPTVLTGHDRMRVFQEEIAGPVLGVTPFTDEAEAVAVTADTRYGRGAGMWTRDADRAHRMGRAIRAGRVWTNCHHRYPAGPAVDAATASGSGREHRTRMLDQYSRTKNLLVSYAQSPLGLF
ncbi:aldehyde dehydrogenase family protein [Pseudonocardia acidicola]|uniref:Aldehyde dehydrogenase family protein n=1 Tax=Pseudonocardia acidicola TaxID=2724939 RepID=A0ABX1S4A6_9PSEU|nr:aldehyde dehydrogenase family protein [Pseudonocardia acidicola]NMH96380.1 aldehyde dehydrogenase family protein [Pseudonocardia acidicola]